MITVTIKIKVNTMTEGHLLEVIVVLIKMQVNGMTILNSGRKIMMVKMIIDIIKIIVNLLQGIITMTLHLAEILIARQL